MSDERWVLDVSCWEERDRLLAFCPLRDNGAVEVGLTYLGSSPPYGEVVGVFSEHGENAVERWCQEHPSVVEELLPVGFRGGTTP